MSDHRTTLTEADVLRDLEAFAPQVRDGFARAGGPSARVLDAIRAEALKAAAERRTALRFRAAFRRVAAAALILLALTGAFQTYLRYNRPSARDQAVTLLYISATTEDGAGYLSRDADTDDLALFLLTMQGPDQDTFFNSPDEMEFL